MTRNRELIEEATRIVIEAFHVPRRPPNLGLDLDGLLDEANDFFH